MMDVCDASPLFLCNNPRNPDMVDSDDRLQTFQIAKNWKNNLEVTERELADAGFYYLGGSDTLKCWYCGGVLKDWKKTDRPWVEHASWYPLCEYILQKQGVEFVEKMVRKNPFLPRPTISNPSNNRCVDNLKKLIQPVKGLVAIEPRKNDIKMQVDWEMSFGENARSAKKHGFDEERIRKALQGRYERYGKSFENYDQLLDAIVFDEKPTVRIECKNCKIRESDTLILPCGHLTYCFECAKSTAICAVCFTAIAARIKTYKC